MWVSQVRLACGPEVLYIYTYIWPEGGCPHSEPRRLIGGAVERTQPRNSRTSSAHSTAAASLTQNACRADVIRGQPGQTVQRIQHQRRTTAGVKAISKCKPRTAVRIQRQTQRSRGNTTWHRSDRGIAKRRPTVHVHSKKPANRTNHQDSCGRISARETFTAQ